VEIHNDIRIKMAKGEMSGEEFQELLKTVSEKEIILTMAMCHNELLRRLLEKEKQIGG
jgi:hypothetical protein